MDPFPSMMSMLDYELNDTLGSSEFDFSTNYENNFGLAGGSDLLSEIFNDDLSFSSFNADNVSGYGFTESMLFPTFNNRQRVNRNNQSKRNRVRIKSKFHSQLQHQQQQQQQQPQPNQQRQFSSILSHTNSSVSKQPQTGRSLIHNTQQTTCNVKTTLHSKSHQNSARARSSTTQQKPGVMPRVYFTQTSPSKQSKGTHLPAKQCRTAAPSVGVSTPQNDNFGSGISLLVKTPEKRKSKKNLARENARKKRRFLNAYFEHDYDEEMQKYLDSILVEENERLKMIQEKKQIKESNIRSEKQRINNDLEDIANGFISEDVLLNELPNCLQDLVDGFGESMLKNNSTEDVLDGLNDACNLMQNKFIDEIINSNDMSDFNLTEDELNEMIGFIGDFESVKDEVDDSAIESASDVQNLNTDKSEIGSVANSECDDDDDESDFFDGATLSVKFAPNTNTSIKRNRRSSGSSSTRRKRRFSSRSSVASDSVNSDSCTSSIEQDSESNSSRPSSPDSMGCYGKVSFRKHPNKKISKSDGNVNENILFVKNIPSGVKKSDLKTWFGKFGSIQHVKIYSNSASITFESPNQTRNAIKYGNEDRRHPAFVLGFGKEQRQSPSRQKFLDSDLFEDDTIDFRIDGPEVDFLDFET